MPDGGSIHEGRNMIHKRLQFFSFRRAPRRYAGRTQEACAEQGKAAWQCIFAAIKALRRVSREADKAMQWGVLSR
jgi:hypothetical protein